jgi:hypothetical protein
VSPLLVEAVSVTLDSSLKVAYERLSVQAPHWTAAQAGDIPDAVGSRRPAVFLRGTPASATLNLRIEGSANTDEVRAVRGTLGGLQLEGTVPLQDGLHVVSLDIQGIGNAIARHVADVAWRLESPTAEPITLANSSLLEVFVILGTPLAAFQTHGVWTEALRLLLLAVGLQGVTDPREVVTRITSFFHFNHGLSYDSAGGRTSYGVMDVGGVFNLSLFLGSSRPQVNCFDMLAAVHVLAGAVGIPTLWLTHPSFGFIAATDVVGVVGNCNNPFFSKENTPPMIVDRKDIRRTSFGVHGFCESAQEIFDACIGPHLGGEGGRQGFLNAAGDQVNHLQLPIPSAGSIDVHTTSPIHVLV